MSLLGLLKGRGPNGFGYASTAEAVTAGLDLSGRTMLVTGCRTGLGLETVRVLGLRGAHIVAVARTLEDARQALAGTGAAGTPLACDLGEPASVRACAEAVRGLGRPLAALVCNAGIMALPRLQQRHGLELQFLTNHIGHFVLVNALLGQLAPDGRVVVVASEAHRGAPAEGIQFDHLDGSGGYRPFRAYGHSKLANILFARALARRLAGTGRTANAVHPGVIATPLGRHLAGPVRLLMHAFAPLVLKTIAEGAATQCYVAAHPQTASANGLYFKDCNPAQPTPQALDDAMGERLWAVSEAIAARIA